ncbi:hypothetical protein LIT13_06760 [Flavobacterium psychrophilum]|uniref:hypothetical protein n=1 Tax=Flavobacterium phage Fpv7 TaxID=1814287 RepID=UPI00078EEE96|nr:hypothetical protein [Flavobacterium psychrophilum]YP_009321215.1 hypothetical protein BOW77_gp10 [Flavobacterium phage Fpv7]YP_009322281.1 hypothetical protein BOW76_gp10 [Flavobacterium phage Fpv8]YP_009322387.1 hypothetical protein BOW79_gp10 [Flavobacterium phage Fpv5]YP_009323681.1 hypothetical protein BOW72_gp10 [Flavobacterium phage Fpv10]YP_009324533.1 hypothetical protein BOW78_gp10 [Flavobacterium phage Fpv6]YP_009325221.1 hypothetical protein BOW83_gp10 [Flavobacterium phage Fpv
MSKFINELLKSSQAASNELSKSMSLLDELMAETLKKAPKEDRKKIEEIQYKTKEVIELAKKGDSKAAQELLKTIKNG